MGLLFMAANTNRSQWQWEWCSDAVKKNTLYDIDESYDGWRYYSWLWNVYSRRSQCVNFLAKTNSKKVHQIYSRSLPCPTSAILVGESNYVGNVDQIRDSWDSSSSWSGKPWRKTWHWETLSAAWPSTSGQGWSSPPRPPPLPAPTSSPLQPLASSLRGLKWGRRASWKVDD